MTKPRHQRQRAVPGKGRRSRAPSSSAEGAKKSRRPLRKQRGRAKRWLGLCVVFVLVVISIWFMPDRVVRRLRALIPGQVERVVVVEGADLYQIASLVEAHGVCPKAQLLAAAKDAPWLAELGLPTASVEGYLAPASYEFFRDSDPREVLKTMVLRRRKDLLDFAEVIPPPPLRSVHDAIILASLVEREVRVPRERPLVARVFLNRLSDLGGETRGRLQSDPSAVYGCLVVEPAPDGCAGVTEEDPARRVTPAMLRSQNNPYNTYRHAGLPPGPIANPGMAVLKAVFRPAQGNQLYFLADGRGGHIFSDTYEEHRRAIERSAVGGGAPEVRVPLRP